VTADSEPPVAVTRKPWSPSGVTLACIRSASWTSSRCTASRSSSRDSRLTLRRPWPSRSPGTSTTTTVSWAASRRRLAPSSAAVRSADLIAGPVGETG
jgi:hypothetical protein